MDLFTNLKKILLKNYLLNATPSKTYKVVRAIMHWLLLPIKLTIIGTLGIYQIIKNSFKIPREPKPITWTFDVDELLNKLPILNSDDFSTYICRQPVGMPIDGQQHNFDHQCLRQGTYQFLLSKLNPELVTESVIYGTSKHIQGPRLFRGYMANPTSFNMFSVSGDMLCGMNLAMLNNKNSDLKDKYEYMVLGIINNDYSLLESCSPDPLEEPMLATIYKERLIEAMSRPEMVNMKSYKASWSAGIEPVGAQALTLLATLRTSAVLCKEPIAASKYSSLLWKYGYGLLSLFPTAYIESRRGYFNEHNCMTSLYVLSKLAKYKWFWKMPMIYVWSLSKHWYNGYFTGLLLDAHPELLKKDKYKNHLLKCVEYLREVRISEVVERSANFSEVETDAPVKLSEICENEFYPEVRHNYKAMGNSSEKIMTGLGYLASLTMCLEALKNIQRTLDNENK